MADTRSPSPHAPLSSSLDHLARLRASIARMDEAERSLVISQGLLSAAFAKPAPSHYVDLRGLDAAPPSMPVRAVENARCRQNDTRSRTMQPSNVVPFHAPDKKDALILALTEEVESMETLLRRTREELSFAEKSRDFYAQVGAAALAILDAWDGKSSLQPAADLLQNFDVPSHGDA